MLGRDQQVQIVRNITLPTISAPKMEVLVLSSSRGMGKTFFLKKLSRMKEGPLTPARKLGRIVSIECEAALILVSSIVYHNNCIIFLLNGHDLISLA
jgi:hypothetical protein